MEKYERIKTQSRKKCSCKGDTTDDETLSECSQSKSKTDNSAITRCRPGIADAIFSHPDRSFLASMLPDLSAMAQGQKRKFKIGVLNLVGEILRGDEEIAAEDGETALEKTERYRPETSEEIFAYPDRSFLASMLPDMQAMTKSEKRRFKVGVLSLVDDLMYGEDRAPTTFKWLDEDQQHRITLANKVPPVAAAMFGPLSLHGILTSDLSPLASVPLALGFESLKFVNPY